MTSAVVVLQIGGACAASLALGDLAAVGAAVGAAAVVAAFAVPVSVAMGRRSNAPFLRLAGPLSLAGAVGFLVIGSSDPGSLLTSLGQALASGDPGEVNRALFVAPGEQLVAASSIRIETPGSFRHQLLEAISASGAIYVLCSKRMSAVRAKQLLAMFFALAVIVMSRSMMMTGAVAALLIWSCRAQVRGASPGLGWRLCQLIGAAALVPVVPTLVARLQGDDTLSYDVRQQAFGTILDIVWHSPVIGDAAQALEGPIPAHNLALDWYSLYGLAGLAAYGAVCLCCWRAMRLIRIEARSTGVTADHCAVMSLIALVMVRSFTSGGRTFTAAVWIALIIIDGYSFSDRSDAGSQSGVPAASLDVREPQGQGSETASKKLMRSGN